jgi:paraquat-inducible protein B
VTKRVHPALIGGFVVSGILLAVAAVTVFASGEFFDRRRTFVSYFPGTVDGLTIGANVSFRGVRIGAVREILLSMDSDSALTDAGASMRIPVIFDVDETLIRERGASLRLDDPEQIQFLVDRGLSARLDSESLVTGRTYVSLDFRPDDNPTLYGEPGEFPEIPAVISPMAQIGEKVQEVADRLLEVDVEALFTSVGTTLDGLNHLITSPELQALPGEFEGMLGSLQATLATVQALVSVADSTVGPMSMRLTQTAEQAEAGLEQLEATLKELRGVVDPRAPLLSGIVETLDELERAARSLRRVAEMIEREPAVLLRGRDPGGDH